MRPMYGAPLRLEDDGELVPAVYVSDGPEPGYVYARILATGKLVLAALGSHPVLPL